MDTTDDGPRLSLLPLIRYDRDRAVLKRILTEATADFYNPTEMREIVTELRDIARKHGGSNRVYYLLHAARVFPPEDPADDDRAASADADMLTTLLLLALDPVRTPSE